MWLKLDLRLPVMSLKKSANYITRSHAKVFIGKYNFAFR